ncbi:hypothetical protein [Amycolatopsis sp. PS_44_ISF1]|uniref:hypothetical protein n=1 Tax=Amycolatopsis sp. PS_44_ISF1 TaxID=2974917 RepID=UPI0028E093AF|nr:hypothetical protein [Amycolatopsis sp. PS_44_ISF1]MDT8912027.1 hypothetical protein [Amycolatopsis sp. PS_44_ISF1]
MRNRTTTRVLTAALAITLALTGTAGAAAARTAPAKRVFNSLQIIFEPDRPDDFCTIGAVGTDRYVRTIAISAGHCLTDPTGRYGDRDIPENVQPVYDRADPAFGPIGYVRYFKDRKGSMTGDPVKDYMIIELVPSVTPSARGPYLTETGELEVPGGQPSPNALNPPLDGERLLATALNDTNELVVSGQLGVSYGRVTANRSGIYQSWAQHKRGDSGGPAIWHEPGTAYPTPGNGLTAAGPWAGITKAIVLGVPPYVYTSSANILADLRARDAVSPGVYGAGFHVTANP